MRSSIFESDRLLVSILVLGGMFGLAGLLSFARPAFAVSYISGITGEKVIMVGGFRQDLSSSDPSPPTIDPSTIPAPEVTAAEVVDRETLVKFVEGSIVSYETAFELYGFDTLAANLDIFREEGGPWRHEHAYLFALTPEGNWFFHGADASKENTDAWDDKDVNGVYFVQDLIAEAKAGGGFVQYHCDDPDLPGDEDTGSPKLGYVESLSGISPGGTSVDLVIGAGLYFDLDDHVGTIELSAEPGTLTEGSTRTVTVTATLTRSEGALPVSVRLPLELSGTAVENTDYTVSGDLVITIPAEQTVGTTELTFTVAEETVDEPGGETIIVTASHDQQDLASATIIVNDVSTPVLPAGDVTAAEVMDRESLKAFVQGAVTAYTSAVDMYGYDRHSEIVESFRVEDGTWKQGDIYLYITETDGDILFHAANPSLEGANLIHLTDLNGVMYVRELIAAARGGGGYVEYYFDDPTVVGDEELGSPKVGYAEPATVNGQELVIGSGFYPDLTNYVMEITLSAEPSTISEDGGAQTVTLTATQSSAPIPISSVIQLSLSGTATEDDYSVNGVLRIKIPADATTGSTDLTFSVTDDTVYESDNETIVVTASHRETDLGSATITVTDSYDAPATVGSPPSVTLDAGDSESLNAGSLFSGTSLSYSASSSDNGVVTAVMSAATLTVTGASKGTATVTVTASNAVETASVAVGVTVTAVAAERMAYQNILAAMGRSMLSSVSTTIAGRFSAGDGGRGVAVGGRRIDGLASGISALAGLTGHRRQARSKHLALLEDTEHGRTVNSGYLMQSSSFSYVLEDHMADGGRRWTVWGTGDWQNFQGEPETDSSYDGNLKTAYVGVDVATGQSWMAGLVLSRNLGQSDYDVTVASGGLETSLTSVLPYVRWTSAGCCTEVWSILGLGTGEVESEEHATELSMRMGMVGMRARVATSQGLGFDVVGDAGLLRLSTSDSESASLGDLTADVRRLRIGLEGSRSSKLGGGTTVTPYAQVAGRYDGGDGQTGQGLEVSGGLRLSGSRIGINAQGRFLAVHSAEGYSENGVSLVAYLRPGAGGQGLSMSVAPRLGASTGDSGMMWRDRPLSGTSINDGSGARALKAEVGYGLASPSMGLLMTPFGEMYLAGDDRRQMRLGARFGGVENNSRKVSLELSGMRVDRRGGESDHRLGLIGRMSF